MEEVLDQVVSSFILRVHPHDTMRIKIKHVQTEEEYVCASLEEAMDYIKQVMHL
ncbi:hypothetical protein BpOF4_03940 [Alkalihalophilus pseudofirmus OF4]|jgi:hypothetical protein|uniref:Uncharacterized protein n=2 Tax=Bacillaceae TaxID=186817 RepID=D3FX99_ALKPO|nr:hypothetical protein BpOF4_03940 [Alkalihalophilus pseudofirmus OF4]